MLSRVLFSLFFFSALGSAASAQDEDVDAVYWRGRLPIGDHKVGGRLSFDDKVLRFSWNAQIWETAVGNVRSIYISLSRHSALTDAFGAYAIPAVLAKERKLTASIVFTLDSGERKGVFIVPELTGRFFSRLAEVSGARVMFETVEARRAAAGPY